MATTLLQSPLLSHKQSSAAVHMAAMGQLRWTHQNILACTVSRKLQILATPERCGTIQKLMLFAAPAHFFSSSRLLYKAGSRGTLTAPASSRPIHMMHMPPPL